MSEKRRKNGYYKRPKDGWRIVRTMDTLGGAARLDGTRLGAWFVAGRFAAGDSISTLAKDYGIDAQAITLCIRAVCKASYHSRGMWANVERKLNENAQRGIPKDKP